MYPTATYGRNSLRPVLQKLPEDDADADDEDQHLQRQPPRAEHGPAVTVLHVLDREIAPAPPAPETLSDVADGRLELHGCVRVERRVARPGAARSRGHQCDRTVEAGPRNARRARARLVRSSRAESSVLPAALHAAATSRALSDCSCEKAAFVVAAASTRSGLSTPAGRSSIASPGDDHVGRDVYGQRQPARFQPHSRPGPGTGDLVGRRAGRESTPHPPPGESRVEQAHGDQRGEDEHDQQDRCDHVEPDRP